MRQYRQALVRMRQGDTDREIARAKVMGRRKAAQLRELAQHHGWLDPEQPLPEDATLADVLRAPKRAATTISSLENRREFIERWAAQGVSGVAIRAALAREQGFTGSYSAVRRMLAQIRGAPEAVRLSGFGTKVERAG